MTLINRYQKTSEVVAIKLVAGIAAGTLLVAGWSPCWGQQASGSRWSTSNPPTPSLVTPESKSEDNGLRRLPPIDEPAPDENKTAPTPQSITAPANEKVAAKPQSAPSAADPVDWSRPSIVIGPEATARTVSHEEEIVEAPKPQLSRSRYSSGPEVAATPPVTGQTSRFTQSAPQPEAEATPEAKKVEPVFARVFDESVDSTGLAQPEAATNDEGLSPIFACRLLGLPATKTGETRRN